MRWHSNNCLITIVVGKLDQGYVLNLTNFEIKNTGSQHIL